VKDAELATIARLFLLRLFSVSMIAAVPVLLGISRPVEVLVSIEDSRGRAVEAVPVRVTRTGGRETRVFFSDRDGRVKFALGGIDKRVDVVVAAGPDFSSSGCPVNPETGLNYAAVSFCGIDPAEAPNREVEAVLSTHTATQQVCRLTGRGAATSPYEYEGQDSAITLPVFLRPVPSRVADILWWFGDTTTDATREIYVSNKMALSDGEADPGRCPELTYVDLPSRGPLSVDPQRTREATVWLDVPLVRHRPGSRGEGLPNGSYGYDPEASDRLLLAYLSVEDTQPFFKITQIGLAEVSACYPICGEDESNRQMATRVSTATWDLPVEYGRAPEGTAFLFDGEYTIVKVAPRRSYCRDDPDKVDCAGAGVSCPGGGECVEPGKFCSEPPHVVCSGDEACPAGSCRAGGVIAMRVSEDRILDKTAYRYWNAETREFDKQSSKESDALLVAESIGNSASIMWSGALERWLMIHNLEAPFFEGMRRVVLRTADSLLGPWGSAATIMENVGGQKSYNPRFVPEYQRGDLVYWTATFDTMSEREPMRAAPFDYNVFLYETDVSSFKEP
jgi:hypothetical protein